jgi:CubicO group peptidase (beta-lactamase class C family)
MAWFAAAVRTSYTRLTGRFLIPSDTRRKVPAMSSPLKPIASLANIKRLPRGFQAGSADRYEFSPAHLADVDMVDSDEPAVVFKAKPKRTLKLKPKLDTDKFVNSLNEYLTTLTVGHAIQLNQNGTPIYFAGVGWAQTKTNLGKRWTADTKMHVASVSKLLTAMGLLKALGTHGWDPNTRIARFLPAYWQQGENINQITFAHLLRHRSGFHVPGTKTDFLTMKREVDAGVLKVGEYSGYENMNFGLMRILIPVINGDLDRHQTFSPNGVINDAAWDGMAIGFYRDYMQDNVFEPAGVSGAGFLPMPAAANGAVAYAFPDLGHSGWNSGDLTTVAGGAGWRLSIKELMSVLNHFRRTNHILSATASQAMLDDGYGLNDIEETDVGKIYWKKGGWSSGRRKEQCVALFLPDDMELVVFANSLINGTDEKINSVVINRFLAAIS